MRIRQAGNLAQVDFFTSTHRLTGEVETGSKPLVDRLNDTSQSYLPLYNVYASRLSEPAEIVAHAPVAFLSKANMNLVIVPIRETRASERTRFAAHEYDVVVTLSGFEVRGKFLGPHRVDLRTFSPSALDPFVTLIGSSAQMVDLPEAVFQGEAILVNRARMECLYLLE
jgi:hypothetical protein